ncbi:MAG: hypothetical protein BGO86_07410 [Chryseobacterium sp. 36-9]|nr:MAG: hypothetical protein BGO86_07410 [Chryseobacterium sp. 36-9]
MILNKLALFFSIFFLFISVAFHAQRNKKAENLFEDAKRLINTDTKKAYQLLLESKKIADKKNQLLDDKIELSFAIIERINGKYQKSIQNTWKVLRRTNYTEVKASAYNNLGACYKNTGNTEEALKYYILASNIYQKENKISDLAIVENNIGLLFQTLEDYNKAKGYHKKALDYFISIGDNTNIAKSYNMIGITLANQDSLQNALLNFKKSYYINRKYKNTIGLSEDVNNIGSIFYYMEKYDSAIVYFRKSLAIDRQNQDFTNLADGLNNLADVYINKRDLKKAKTNLDSAVYYSKKYNYISAYLNSLQAYSNLYESDNKPKLSLKYLKQYYTTKDSLSKENNIKDINELEKKYQTEKKQKEIIQKDSKIKRKNLLNIILVILFCFGIIISFLVYRTLKLKNKQQKQEYELKYAIEEIAHQNKLQEQRLSISRDLHDNIGAQLTFIISSIETLKQAFNIKDEKINNKLTSISNFTKDTITELRDTIWAMNHSEIDFNEIRNRILNFVEKARKSTENINIAFERDPILDNLHFSSVDGMNIYRITQEAVNNAMKYAEAKNILLNAKSVDHQVQITVADDGKGFDIDETELGNGIRNMEKRASELNSTLSINSETGKGTIITLVIPKT